MNFTINNPMPPLWMMYPHISRYCIGWRMGYGEGYKIDFFRWQKTLSADEKSQYIEMFPSPKLWRGYWNPQEDSDDLEEENLFEYGLLSFWNEHGKMRYTKEQLIKKSDQPINADDCIFFKPDNTSFNIRQDTSFQVDVEEYHSVFQYLMAEKAYLYEDKETEEAIINASNFTEIEKLAQQIKIEDKEIWKKCQYSVLLNGNYYKFVQNKELRKQLLATENKILIETDSFEQGGDIHKVDDWKGDNVLGFGLMEVRDEIKAVYKNEAKIDWKSLEKYL